MKGGEYDVEFSKAKQLLFQGRFDEALAAFREVLRLQPLRASAPLYLAETLLQSGRIEEAFSFLRVLRRNTARRPPQDISDRIQRYRVSVALCDFREAERIGERLLDLTRSLAALEALAWPVLIEERSGDKPDAWRKEAEKRLERYVSARPRSPWGRYFRIYLLERMRAKHPSVVGDSLFLRKLPVSRYGWMRYEQGRYYMYAGDFAGAIVDFSAALRCSRPINWRASCRIAETRLCAGDLAGALREFGAAEKIDAGSRRADVLALRAGALFAVGEYARAQKVLSHAVGLGALHYPRHYEGGLWVMLGRYEQALGSLDAVIRATPGESLARVWRTEALWRLGRLDEAREEADFVVSHHGRGNFFAHVLRGLVRSSLKDERGLQEDCRAIPRGVVGFAASRRPSLNKMSPSARGPALLKKILELSRGVRNDGYMRYVWMNQAVRVRGLNGRVR